MLNLYTPFPRYENAIIVGDTAAEALAQLHIYARGLIGGDIPAMETLHPTEKFLECTHCALKHRPQILDAAAKRIQADYILLEDNGHPGLNPVTMANALIAEGFNVRILDVRGTPAEILRRAGAMFGEEKQAERIIRDMETRMARRLAQPPLPPRRVLPILGIRHPIENVVYAFAATDASSLAKAVLKPLGLACALASKGDETLPGVMDPTLETNWPTLLTKTSPDLIVLCGDAAAAQTVLFEAHEGRMPNIPCIALPWYCESMGCRLARTLEIWDGTLRAMSLFYTSEVSNA